MLRRLGFWILVLVWVIKIDQFGAIPIDNGVTGTSVQCTSESIVVNFTTRNAFNGRIFVKGMSEHPECVRSYFDGGPIPTTPLIMFTFGECNMVRSRMIVPQPGMMQTIVVIISFHRTFITKVDKAYKVQCFYTEAEKSVTSQLEVSMLSTELARHTQAMPTCTYQVRRGNRAGDVVRYANVGDSVYHEWECDSAEFTMLVKNCFVDDGQGNKQLIVDETGCAVDPYILPDLTYDLGNAKAWVESHVFKYADKSNLFFQCIIRLCMKGDTSCSAISPPNCPRTMTPADPVPPAPPVVLLLNTAASNNRRIVLEKSKKTKVKRSPSSWTTSNTNGDPMEMDLMTEPISVLDLDYDNRAGGGGTISGGARNSRLRVIRDEIIKARSSTCDSDSETVCISRSYLIFGLIGLGCLSFSIGFCVICTCVRKRLRKSQKQ